MSSAGSAGSLLEALRGATRDSHARVDGAFGTCDFAADADYARFLAAQAIAWETLRPILSDASLERADALRVDIASLGLAEAAPLDVGTLPSPSSLGARYVLEGSRLGSTVLLRQLDAKGSARSIEASHYLRVSANPAAWKQLSTLLQTDCDGSDKIEGEIRDALFVFGLFESAWRATDSADDAKVAPGQ